MNARELSKWIKESVKFQLEHINGGFTCHRMLDDNFAVHIGWSGGFDSEDEDAIHHGSDPEWCLCIKIAENLKDEYDWVYMPWDVKTEEVWDTDTPLRVKGSYYTTAKWLLGDYRAMRKELREGKITFRS